MDGESLAAAPVTRKSGQEPFIAEGHALPERLEGFWAWSCSNLLGNALRGQLAEYLVGLALGCVEHGVRREWDAFDLRTAAGTRVEVKSAAYLQSWDQTGLSTIRFGISPSTAWFAESNTYATDRRRQADVYVFALFAQTDKSTANPLDTDQWRFYVTDTARLDSAVGEQSSITLNSLLTRVQPVRATFAELADAVSAAAERNHKGMLPTPERGGNKPHQPLP